MATQHPIPAWIFVGATVHRLSGRESVPSRHVVTKITATQVVLDSDLRFRLNTLDDDGRLVRNTVSEWMPSELLCSGEDPKVVAAYARQRVQSAQFRADTAYDTLRRTRTAEAGREVIAAIETWIKLLPSQD
ncbi:hypothetical protein [Oerskovia enterophila]|uniref:AbiEi antitoxin C-terminal domain-containing protein n=1 Tax=Oerskovia enterophila TaxID=43678 RepID=A0ABX2Y897_9CELL|nr:hypothetical protein [Oerskovia enterophila]OCI32818.1 hypothetical protein OERS_04100 [Oerskovia enterophila]